MNLDDLKQAWREEMNAEVLSEQISFKHMIDETKELDRATRLGRNVIIGMSIAVITLEIFVWFFVKPELNLAQQVSMALIPVMFVYLSFVMSRSLLTGAEDNWTLSTRLEIEIEKLARQVSVARSIPLQFLTPMFVAVILGAYGGYYGRTQSLVPDADLIIYFGFGIILFAGTAWGYLRSERKKLTPLLNRLVSLQHQLEDTTYKGLVG